MNIAKKVVRLTKEQREAKKAKIAEKKAKLKEKRAQKKAARLAKLEAKKQKLAEKRAIAKEKREAKKAKELAKRQLMREHKAQKKLDAKLNKKNLKKSAKQAKALLDEKIVSDDNVKKSHNAKLEAERAEFKALSAVRRYIKDHLKELIALDDMKRSKKIKKLTEMGYSIVEVDGAIASISYSFTANNTKIKKISKQPKEIVESNTTEEQKEDTDKHMNIDEQPKDSDESLSLEDFASEIDDTSIDSEDDTVEDTTNVEEVLVGDAYKDETEVAAEVDDHINHDAEDSEESEDSEDDDDDEDDEDDNHHDDRFGFSGDISDDQADYRRDAFKDAELDGMYD